MSLALFSSIFTKRRAKPHDARTRTVPAGSRPRLHARGVVLSPCLPPSLSLGGCERRTEARDGSEHGPIVLRPHRGYWAEFRRGGLSLPHRPPPAARRAAAASLLSAPTRRRPLCRS